MNSDKRIEPTTSRGTSTKKDAAESAPPAPPQTPVVDDDGKKPENPAKLDLEPIFELIMKEPDESFEIDEILLKIDEAGKDVDGYLQLYEIGNTLELLSPEIPRNEGEAEQEAGPSTSPRDEGYEELGEEREEGNDGDGDDEAKEKSANDDDDDDDDDDAKAKDPKRKNKETKGADSGRDPDKDEDSSDPASDGDGANKDADNDENNEDIGDDNLSDDDSEPSNESSVQTVIEKKKPSRCIMFSVLMPILHYLNYVWSSTYKLEFTKLFDLVVKSEVDPMIPDDSDEDNKPDDETSNEDNNLPEDAKKQELITNIYVNEDVGNTFDWIRRVSSVVSPKIGDFKFSDFLKEIFFSFTTSDMGNSFIRITMLGHGEQFVMYEYGSFKGFLPFQIQAFVDKMNSGDIVKRFIAKVFGLCEEPNGNPKAYEYLNTNAFDPDQANNLNKKSQVQNIKALYLLQALQNPLHAPAGFFESDFLAKWFENLENYIVSIEKMEAYEHTDEDIMKEKKTMEGHKQPDEDTVEENDIDVENIYDDAVQEENEKFNFENLMERHDFLPADNNHNFRFEVEVDDTESYTGSEADDSSAYYYTEEEDYSDDCDLGNFSAGEDFDEDKRSTVSNTTSGYNSQGDEDSGPFLEEELFQAHPDEIKEMQAIGRKIQELSKREAGYVAYLFKLLSERPAVLVEEDNPEPAVA